METRAKTEYEFNTKKKELALIKNTNSSFIALAMSTFCQHRDCNVKFH